jgi:hypothetical protein
MLNKNKKATVHVPLIVFMTLILVITSLFFFSYNTNKFEARISDARVVEVSYSIYDSGEFYINKVGEKSLVESYFEIVNENDYTKGKKNSEGYVEFSGLSNDLDKKIENSVEAKFKENFNEYELENPFIIKIKESINAGNFRVLNENDKLSIVVSKLEFTFSSNNVKVVYFPEISSKLDLKKIGLNSFSEIYAAKEKCKKEVLIKGCFEKELVNFDVSVLEKGSNEKYFLVNIKSKKEFFVNNEFKKIELSFVSI